MYSFFRGRYTLLFAAARADSSAPLLSSLIYIHSYFCYLASLLVAFFAGFAVYFSTGLTKSSTSAPFCCE